MKLVCSAVAKKMNNFSIVIDTEAKFIKLKQAKPLPPATKPPTIQINAEEEPKKIIWKPYQKKLLMDKYLDLLNDKDCKHPWKRLEEILDTHYDIKASNEQIRSCVSINLNSYHKL